MWGGFTHILPPGWLRDLTRECVEANPGPSLKQILDRVRINTGAAVGDKTSGYLDKLEAEISKANNNNLFLTDVHVLGFFAQHFNDVVAIVPV